MRTNVKKFFSTAAICALLCSGMVMAGHEAQAAPPGIPVQGKTADGKYPVYAIQGEIDDLSYFSQGKMWQPNDLINRMGYVNPADIRAGGIQCDWTCKNPAGQTVGLNPAIKKMH